jgi:hypothetical protein
MRTSPTAECAAHSLGFDSGDLEGRSRCLGNPRLDEARATVGTTRAGGADTFATVAPVVAEARAAGAKSLRPTNCIQLKAAVSHGLRRSASRTWSSVELLSYMLRWAALALRRFRRRCSPPFDGGEREDRYRKNAQSDDDHPLDRTVMLIGIPAGDRLDPVREEWRDEPQQTGERGQDDFGPNPPRKIISQAESPSRFGEAPAFRGSRHSSFRSSSSSSSQHG